MNKALLDISGLPKFSQIKIADIEPAIEEVLKENNNKLDALMNKSETHEWSYLIEVLEQMDNKLSRVWSPVSHMNSVVNTEEIREAHDKCLPKLSAYSTEQAQNCRLFETYKKIKNSSDYENFDHANKKVIENALLKFKLNGVALDTEKKKKFKDIKKKAFKPEIKI